MKILDKVKMIFVQ